MKKLLIVLLGLGLVLGGCTSKKRDGVLRVYAPGAYIAAGVREEFEDKYNVSVVYETFDSNESMYTRIMNGNNYDVLVPSDYMIQRLIDEDLLQPLDFSQISNFSEVDPFLLSRHYDPNNEYTAPYFWGNVGIVYNKNTVSLSALASEGWNILQNTDYRGKLFFYNSERDAFMIALKALGYSANTTNPDELLAAYEWLSTMKATMAPIFYGDETIDAMIGGQKDIAIMYSGDANYVISENEDMDYYVPEEGSNLWVDAMVITKNAENVEMAHNWINFILSYDIALVNAEEIGYTSPRLDVVEAMIGDDGAYEGISSYVPRTDNPLDEEFYFNEDTKNIMGDYWTKILAQ